MGSFSNYTLEEYFVAGYVFIKEEEAKLPNLNKKYKFYEDLLNKLETNWGCKIPEVAHSWQLEERFTHGMSDDDILLLKQKVSIYESFKKANESWLSKYYNIKFEIKEKINFLYCRISNIVLDVRYTKNELIKEGRYDKYL